MNFTNTTRRAVQAIAIVLALALPAMATMSPADARAGRGFSFGSRGSHTFSMPPRTSTAPRAALPFNRSYGQPSRPSFGRMGGGYFHRPGGGLLRGLAAGFLGAGLFGLLFGGGLFSGIGGFSSMLGLILQIGLIVLVARWAMAWWQRRKLSQPAYADAALGGSAANLRGGMGFGMGAGSAPLQILPADYEAFERLLGDIQAAWSDEDIARLGTRATPEMVQYFEDDLQDNRARNQINKVSATRLLQGDLAEAWREGNADYASVAMRFSMIDRTLDRSTGQLVGGSDQPTEAVEVWTFVRQHGGNWRLSAIQQTT
jgi:predicted lipid-binding transport protein (Tim44 family)